ncbi:hypothetical protein D3C81_1244670 [compost metagenome]
MIREFKVGGSTIFNVTVDQLLEQGHSMDSIKAALSAQELEDTEQSRRVAYRGESDPLYMEWQYDQTDTKEQQWRAKVAEIKARYPLPE